MSTSELILCSVGDVGRSATKRRFKRLRGRLRIHRVASLRFVYYASWGSRLVTLCATSTESERSIELSPEMLEKLIRAFFRWMSVRRPDWSDGPDAAGVLDWDVRCNAFTHRHCGYTQHFFRSSRQG